MLLIRKLRKRLRVTSVLREEIKPGDNLVYGAVLFAEILVLIHKICYEAVEAEWF
jgi:hypothetical protein